MIRMAQLPLLEPVGERELVATAKGFRLAYLLLLRGPMTHEQIAAELEITLRHVYRIIAKCELAGPLAQDENGRVYLMMNAADWL